MIEPEYMEVVLTISGDGFNPEMLKDLVLLQCMYCSMEFSILISTGEVSKRGKYKGEPSPYGLCSFKVPNKTDNKIGLITSLYHRIKQLNQDNNLSIENFNINLYFSGNQGNMELSHSELKDLANTESSIGMNYDYIDE